jgi:hypothetical protein
VSRLHEADKTTVAEGDGEEELCDGCADEEGVEYGDDSGYGDGGVGDYYGGGVSE